MVIQEQDQGKKFRAYREQRRFSAEGLFVIPGFMSVQEPYLISCAEEYLFFEYFKKNNKLPPANTK